MLPQDSDGYAIPAADLLSDFLCEHQCDEDEGPPESWPDWTDKIELDLGTPSCREECIDDPGIDITDNATLEELRHWERFPGSPDESEPDLDQLDQLDQLDRYLIDPELAHWLAYGRID